MLIRLTTSQADTGLAREHRELAEGTAEFFPHARAFRPETARRCQR